MNFDISRIKLGVYPVIYGFGDIGRCGRLWLFELALALAFYPGLRVYGLGAKVLRKHTGLFYYPHQSKVVYCWTYAFPKARHWMRLESYPDLL